MIQQNLFDPVLVHKYDLLSREELVKMLTLQSKALSVVTKDNDRLRALHDELKQKSIFIEEQYITIKGKLFGRSSERSSRRSSAQGSESKKKRVQLPSERYPSAPLIEKHVTLDKLPPCKCCGSEMPDSGMTEESEYLTKVPSQYYVVVQVRHKYACRKCHGDIVTAPAIPRLKEGSSYSDELVIDVAISKYCDLIPIERQSQMAAREGFKGLPPQSLIEGTHNLANFVKEAYVGLKAEMLASSVWHADETPHRMLEGDKSPSWFLWGFSNQRTSYFECHDTRSGDVASGLLIGSSCQYLVSDVFSGYSKAVKETNKIRIEKSLPAIQHVYCNAHARRYFKQSSERFPEESKFYISQYRRIYRLEKLANNNPKLKLKIRDRQRKYFKKIRDKCLRDLGGYSTKSKLGNAMNYFLKNYDGFTRFLGDPELPIDNNPAENLLRNPVIGRKTWYGTHSKRGAETAAILFSLMQSCKLNRINPREYFKNLVQDLHQGENAYTPKVYKDLHPNP